jgi:hypothetical protein
MVVLLAGIQNPASFVIDLEVGSEKSVRLAPTNAIALIPIAQDPVIDQQLRHPTIALNHSDPLATNRPPKNLASSYRPKNIADSRNLCALLMKQ